MAGESSGSYASGNWGPAKQAPHGWSVHLGYFWGVDVRLHVHFPILAFVAIYGCLLYGGAFSNVGVWSYSGSSQRDSSQQDSTRKSSSYQRGVEIQNSSRLPEATFTFTNHGVPWKLLQPVFLGLLILLGSVAVHELGRLIVVHRLHGQFDCIVLGPTGGWTAPRLPVDPLVHLVTAMTGPVIYLSLMVLAASGLVLAGHHQMLDLLRPFSPKFQSQGSWLLLAAQLTVWINWLLLLVNLLPVDPFDGAASVRGMLWPLFGRASESAMSGRIAMLGALMLTLLAISYRHVMLDTLVGVSIPVWLPLGLLAIVLLWGGNRDTATRLNLGEPLYVPYEEEEEVWHIADWSEEEFSPVGEGEVVLVERTQERQQRALDQKRREQEAYEDKQVDTILARLGHCSLAELSEEERTILKRASRRYRKRRENG